MQSITEERRNIELTIEELNGVLYGQRDTIRKALAAFLAGGHILLEDVPGTGKTTLANSFANLLGLSFSRVQGTPDLLPSELVGTLVFHPGTGEFSFRRGPVFTQILLMDEINRATPRTQSALLSAMAEQEVSIDGRVEALPQPFFVIATANPVESHGVFPLPEAQLDRFLVRLRLGYPTREEELQLLQTIQFGARSLLRPVWTSEDLQRAKSNVHAIKVSQDVSAYVVDLCRATREHDELVLGASPRAVLALTQFARALAYVDGRDYVLPDDVKEAWIPVLAHRVVPHGGFGVRGDVGEAERILSDILGQSPVPTEFEVPL